ncbi:MAG: redoxin domain-containing protein [Candidatus Glassbacteria bacterium]
MKKVMLISVALLLSLAVIQPAQARLSIGDPAPDFTLNDVDGNPHSLSDFTGYVVMLNWWASY